MRPAYPCDTGLRARDESLTGRAASIRRVAPTPNQLVWRRRIETGLRIAEPGLNLVLAVGDRVSRWVDRGQPDTYVPARRVETDTVRRHVGAGPEA